MKGEPIVILLVEDDDAHAEIVRRNLEECTVPHRLIRVSDGQEALDYLYRKGKYKQPSRSPAPGVVLLDLRLPRVDGLEVLRTVKGDPGLSMIPVVILTTSSAETDMVKAYETHANSYLVKPANFEEFHAQMESFGFYWLRWNQFPD